MAHLDSVARDIRRLTLTNVKVTPVTGEFRPQPRLIPEESFTIEAL